MKEDIEAKQLSSIGIKFRQSIEDDDRQISDEEDIISNTQRFNHRLVASVQIWGKQTIAIDGATREQQRKESKPTTEQLVKYLHIDTVPEPPKNPTNIRQQQAFLSAE